MIEMTINDKKISVEPRTTILKAALENGIYIPHLCFDKRLAPYGGCRLCIVEVEGQRKLLASCSTPAEQGMIVSTETPKLSKARKTILELLLVHHPTDCPQCDKAGDCDLQDLVFKYGKPDGRFKRKRKDAPTDVRGPLVELNSNRCILCGKCVRICSEYQCRGALGLIGRGFPTKVQPAFGEAIECDYCGQCVDICPTGALLAKPYKFLARPWFLEEKDAICPFCGCGCTLTLGIREGQILKARGKEGEGVSRGDLCGKGRFGFDYLYSENRLKTPLIRINGDLVPATWQEAFNYISLKLNEIMQSGGPSQVAAIGSHRCTNEDNYMLSKFMRTVVGTNNIDSSARFGYGAVQDAFFRGFGVKSHPARLDSPSGKEIILVLESDPSVTHPVFGLNILKAQREGSSLIVVDPKNTKLSRNCNRWLRSRPGTSIALLNGIMKTIIDESLFDRRSASRIGNFPALEASLKNYTPKKVSDITGLPEEDITALARDIAKAKSRLISLGLRVAENTKGQDTVLAAINLLLLIGDGPESLQSPAEFSNTYGLYRMGIRPDIGGGKNIAEMLYDKGEIKALYVMGEDPLVNFPDTSSVMETLRGLDLLVVQDIALTSTAKLAHVVLPAASWVEKDGSFTNAEGLTQSIHKVVDAPGQSLPDWQIIRNLAMVMGKDIGAKSLDALRAEISGFIKSDSSVTDSANPVFNPVHYVPAGADGGDYPLLMVTRDLLQHSGTMSTRSKSLCLAVGDAFIEINENDAARCGVSDNSHVKVTSKNGSVYLKTKVSDSVPAGVVFVPTNFPHAGVNILTGIQDGGNATPETIRVEKTT
jgi:NADH-quinone oxidoreductase chain G